jgi:molecular chaperone DnaK (HSP70)
MVAHAVEELFGRAPSRSLDPDEVVAIGASIQAYALTRSALEAFPLASPASLSFGDIDETIPESARLDVAAVVREAVREARASGGQIGATSVRLAQAAPLLIDVTPLSLGVEIVGGYVDTLIPAGAPVPCEKARAFSTAADGQVAVTIRVAQGEEERFEDNTCLGELELSGLRSAPRGDVKIEVTFELDADGILRVRARDVFTGQETVATMRLLGTTNDASRVAQLLERQAQYAVT